jgi:hypothetical protein
VRKRLKRVGLSANKKEKFTKVKLWGVMGHRQSIFCPLALIMFPSLYNKVFSSYFTVQEGLCVCTPRSVLILTAPKMAVSLRWFSTLNPTSHPAVVHRTAYHSERTDRHAVMAARITTLNAQRNPPHSFPLWSAY